jgi:hypothetical protein
VKQGFLLTNDQQVVEKLVFLRLFKGSRGRSFLATTKLLGTFRTAASL